VNANPTARAADARTLPEAHELQGQPAVTGNDLYSPFEAFALFHDHPS